MDRVLRRGPLAPTPGALKRKKVWKKKSHNSEKLKGGPFGVFQHPFCRKTSKNGRGKIFTFGKKSHNAEKN